MTKQYIGTLLPNDISITEILYLLYHEFSSSNIIEDVNVGESHDFPEMLYVVDGCHVVYLNGFPYTVNKGQILIYAPNTIHTGTSDAKAYIFSFRCSSQVLSNIFNQVITLSNDENDTLFSLMTEHVKYFKPRSRVENRAGMMLAEHSSSFNLSILKKNFEIFFEKITERIVPSVETRLLADKENVFQTIVEYMKKHLHTRISLNDIAYTHNMSVSALKLLFRENNVESPMNYFNNLKMTEAKRLLIDSNYSITTISESLGFSSVHYFTQFFKNKSGITPSEYRHLK